MKHVRPYLWIALLCVAACTGCGRNDAQPAADTALAGPPQWRLTQEGSNAGETSCTLKMASPGRVRFRYESHGGISRPSVWRSLAGGQTVTLTWAYERLPTTAVADRAGPEDEAAGRTQAHGFNVLFGFGDRVKTNERFVAYARPGTGRALGRSLLPPGIYETLPAAAVLELVTVAVADVAQGEVVLRSRELQGVVRKPDTMTPDDRVVLARVFLDVEVVAEER